jgi:hypothetical protein
MFRLVRAGYEAVESSTRLGGQTDADRAGLDFAIETGLEHGRYVPTRIVLWLSSPEESDLPGVESVP